jgi:dihydrodipicolinate synthase/N-acetylneuraminate lyase
MRSNDRDPDDAFLEELVHLVDRRLVVSGIGERPAIDHLTGFGLQGFTSGAACVAPRHSMAMLRALKDGRVQDARALQSKMLPLEDLRDEISPIRVLHDAVTDAGIADMGPMLPMLANVPEVERSRITEVARALAREDVAFGE